MVQLKFKKLWPNVNLPTKTSGNIGIDLSCYCTKDKNSLMNSGWFWDLSTDKMKYNLRPGERRVFNTGLSVEIPDGYALILKDRSGLAAKHGIHVLAGVIDSSYRGEIKVCLLNTCTKYDEIYVIEEGERIAQAILTHDISCDIIEVSELSETERGSNGFGSTGK